MNTSEPFWWQRARELRAKGLSRTIVGRICGGYDHTTVRYATDPEYRAKKRAMMTGKWHRQKRDQERTKMVRVAHEEAEATGEHVDIVLMRWGERPRRQRVTA